MKKSAKAKLTTFDLHLLQRVAAGENAKDIELEMRVDPGEFAKRLAFLVKHRMIVPDSTDKNVLRLGVKGYDELNAVQEKAVRKKEKDSLVAGSENEKTAAVPSIPPVSIDRETDLSELASKYGPKEGQRVPRGSFTTLSRMAKGDGTVSGRLGSEAVSGKSGSEVTQRSGAQQRASSLSGAQAQEASDCALCKEPFSLAIGGDRHAFGRCFCGAVYHKDCYQSQIEAEGKCVRCGKKLLAVLDKGGEEAVKGIKDVFD